MDARRFDDLARGLARRASRRAVLRGMAGGAVAGALVHTRVPSSLAQTCETGEELCGDTCVDLMTDMENCGACGAICESGLVEVACVAGVCVRVNCPLPIPTSCSDDLTIPLEERCVDLTSDPDNCGECGNVCESGACVDSTCTPADGSGELGDLGDACSEVLPCRAEFVCANGVCSEPADDDDEDEDEEEDDSVTLPNTGTGGTSGHVGTDGSGWLKPAALAGAAAVLAHRLRGTTEAKGPAD